MIRTRVFLLSLCAVALILIPLSSTNWAQSSTQQDQPNQSDINRGNQNIDRSQDANQNPSTTGQSNVGQTDNTRQKPSSTAEPGTMQNPENRGSQTGDQTNKANRNLPKTAEELPLVLVLGLVFMGLAASTRAFARSHR